MAALRWRHNGRDGVSNHQPYDCLLNRLCRRRSKKTSKLRITGLCAENSPGTGEFPAQMFPFDDVIMKMHKHGLMYNVEPLRFDIIKTKKSLQHRVGILYDILYIISQNIVSVDTSVSSILRKWLTVLSARYTFPCDAHQAYFHIEAAKNGRHYASDIFKCHFLKEDLRISIRISLKFAPEGPIDINSSLVQIMARHRMNGRKTTIWTNGGLMYSVEIS